MTYSKNCRRSSEARVYFENGHYVPLLFLCAQNCCDPASSVLRLHATPTSIHVAVRDSLGAGSPPRCKSIGCVLTRFQKGLQIELKSWSRRTNPPACILNDGRSITAFFSKRTQKTPTDVHAVRANHRKFFRFFGPSPDSLKKKKE